MNGILQFFGELLKSNSLLSGPNWFDVTGVYFDFIFIIIALLVCAISYKAYRMTQYKKYFFFSSAFGFFAISFGVKFATNLSKLMHAHSNISQAVMPALSSQTFFHFGRLIYVFFVLLALTIILLCSMKIHKRRLVAFFIALLSILSLATYHSVGIFYLLALLFLSFITLQYYFNFKKSRKLNAGLIFFAFLLMMVQYLLLAVSIMSPLLYVGAYVLQMVAFLIIFLIMLRVLLK